MDSSGSTLNTASGGVDEVEETLTSALEQEVAATQVETPGQKIARFVLVSRSVAITVVGILLFIFFSATTTTFLVADNLLSMVRDVSLVGIVAVGMTIIFVAGEIDLSIGSVYGFLMVIMGILVIQAGIDPWLAMILVIGLGGLIGLMNGLIVTRLGIPSFIATLAMLTAFRSAALLVAGDHPLVSTGIGSFYDMTGGNIVGNIPWFVVWLAIITISGAFILWRTTFGYHVYAVGGNEEAAVNSGINAKRVKVICFVLISALCGLIGAMVFGYLHVTDPTTGTGFEFRVAGAVLIGGITLGGGRGTVYGSFIGAIIVGMIGRGLVLLGLDPHYSDLATGLLIMVTGALDLYVRRAASRSLRYLEG